MNSGPAIGLKDVTTSDTVDISATRGLYVGVGGDVKVTMFEGSVSTLTGLASGMVHPLSVTRVWATGTTATGIKAVY